MQIAVTLPDEFVDDLDKLVPTRFTSRSEAVRTAVASMLLKLERDNVDATFISAYERVPQSVDDIDAGRATTERQPAAWDDLAW